jgi:hypothetical protein
MVFGIHWNNVSESQERYDYGRVDLDLKTMNLFGSYGWDCSYRRDDRGLLFSGDITDAPKLKGASELFYVKPRDNNSYIVTLNTYSGQKDIPYKIFIASEEVRNMYSNYMVNPNNIIVTVKSKTSVDSLQKTLGIVVTSPEGNKFIFAEGDMISKITSRYDKHADEAKRFLLDYYGNMISLNDMLKFAGVKMVTEPSIADINLSPENLTKDMILNLLK